jgi:ectopic P granules protein 5
LSPEHFPTWDIAHQNFGASQVNFDHHLLVNNDFFLSLYLLSVIKLQFLHDDIDRVTFLQDLQTKLAERKTTEATESKAALLWGFLIISGGHIMKRSDVSKKQLLIIARFFQVNITQPEGWGDGLLGAIGLKRDGQSNKKKILLRCLSCAIFALFTESQDPLPSSEYENAMTELKNALSNKRFADVRMAGMQAISLIENKTDAILEDFSNVVSSLIKMFYQESFLNSFLINF